MDETLIQAILETAQNQNTMMKAMVSVLDKLNEIQKKQEQLEEALNFLSGKTK